MEIIVGIVIGAALGACVGWIQDRHRLTEKSYDVSGPHLSGNGVVLVTARTPVEAMDKYEAWGGNARLATKSWYEGSE